MAPELRTCFLPPIHELHVAAHLLEGAADAMLVKDLNLARTLIVQADIRAIYDFLQLVATRVNPEIHRQTRRPRVTVIPGSRTQRMPGAIVQEGVFQRDGWRCRYCNCRVISKKALQIMRRAFPVEARFGPTDLERHFAMEVLRVSLDHIIPHSRGGTHDIENLVSACGVCQFGRDNWTLEEVGFSDPRDRPPIVDSWDGLTRLAKRTLQPPRSEQST